jgi:hypothetical protein
VIVYTPSHESWVLIAFVSVKGQKGYKNDISLQTGRFWCPNDAVYNKPILEWACLQQAGA